MQGSHVVAVGPVASKEAAIFAEKSPKCVEMLLIERDVSAQAAVRQLRDFGELDGYFRCRRRLAQIGRDSLLVLGCYRLLHVGEVVDDDLQLGHAVR